LPSNCAYEAFIAGMALTACTIANPMRCVKETFPPRARLRKLLTTMRLSISSFAGTARTEVAVGTSSDTSMFVTTRAAGPLSTVVCDPPPAGVEAAGGAVMAASRGTPLAGETATGVGLAAMPLGATGVTGSVAGTVVGVDAPAVVAELEAVGLAVAAVAAGRAAAAGVAAGALAAAAAAAAASLGW
jgi:hypothetical protein